MTTAAFRASVFHCLENPALIDESMSVEYIEDAVLYVRDGRVEKLGAANQILPTLPGDVRVQDYADGLIVPGFVDCHVHFPQIDIVGSYGAQLIEWLHNFAFPAEEKFGDAEYAQAVANVFLDEMLRNGTTTALVFATVHPESVDAIMTAALRRNIRLLAGKVLMDRDCPESLRDSPELAYRQSLELIERWHGQGRLGYAITPRFALTSSEQQLAEAGKLAAEYPEVHIHTHLAENPEEVARVAARFPDSRSYLDVYDRFGLVRQRSVFAHCLHIDDEDRQVMGARGASIAFCPSSNLFLGSGLFDLASARQHGIRTGIGSDVGGGTSLSTLRTLADGYKVLQLNGQSLSALEGVYLATLGGARALDLDSYIGNFEIGKEADFVVLDKVQEGLTGRRLSSAGNIAESLFALMTLGDDRAVRETRILGQLAWSP